MKHPLKHYAIAFYEALHAPDASTSFVIKHFVRILARDGVLNKSNAIIERFLAYWNERQGELSVEVTTARDLTETLKRSIAAAVARHEGAAHVVLHNIVDPSILGGTAMKIGDTLIDGSVRRQLAIMKQKLVS